MEYKKIDKNTIAEVRVGRQIKLDELEEEKKRNNEVIEIFTKDIVKIPRAEKRVVEILQDHNAQLESNIDSLKSRNKDIDKIISNFKA